MNNCKYLGMVQRRVKWGEIWDSGDIKHHIFRLFHPVSKNCSDINMPTILLKQSVKVHVPLVYRSTCNVYLAND